MVEVMRSNILFQSGNERTYTRPGWSAISMSVGHPLTARLLFFPNNTRYLVNHGLPSIHTRYGTRPVAHETLVFLNG